MTVSSKLCSDMLGYQDISKHALKILSRDIPDSVSYMLWQLDTLPLLSTLAIIEMSIYNRNVNVWSIHFIKSRTYVLCLMS